MMVQRLLRSPRMLLAIVIAAFVIGDVAVAFSNAEDFTEIHAAGLKYGYTFGECETGHESGKTLRDPINVVWLHGLPAATPAKYIANILGDHGWGNDDYSNWLQSLAKAVGLSVADEQYIHRIDGSCIHDGAQRATAFLFFDRDHVRLFHTANRHGTNYVVGDAHHDETTNAGGCNLLPDDLGIPNPAWPLHGPAIIKIPKHRASEYNGPRDRLAALWRSLGAHTEPESHFWGNNFSIRQCDGSRVQSNGAVAYMSGVIPRAHTARSEARNTKPPTITGEPVPGATLTAHPGSWDPAPSSFDYEWCEISVTREECTPIPGATGRTWIPEASELGESVAVRVRAAGAPASHAVLSPSVRIGTVLYQDWEHGLESEIPTPEHIDPLTGEDDRWLTQPVEEESTGSSGGGGAPAAETAPSGGAPRTPEVPAGTQPASPSEGSPLLSSAPAAAASTEPNLWHVQRNPEDISMSPSIVPELVTLPEGDSGSLPAPVSGSHVAWFGEASSGTFCAGFSEVAQTAGNGCTSATPVAGSLVSPPFSLQGAADAILRFHSWFEIEAVEPSRFDLMEVDYTTQTGTAQEPFQWQPAAFLNPASFEGGSKDARYDYTDHGFDTPASWEEVTVDLRRAAGSPHVRIRFVFKSRDKLYNGFRGWLIDDVNVFALPSEAPEEPGKEEPPPSGPPAS